MARIGQFTGHSRQYELLMEMWNDKHQQLAIRTAILKELHEPMADCCLKDEFYFYHDGLFDIVPPECAYVEYCRDNGNEDDECQLLVAMWCLVMAENGNPDYLVHIAHFMKVEIEGY